MSTPTSASHSPVMMAASISQASLAALDDASLTRIEGSVRASKTVDDFTRILGEFRSGRAKGSGASIVSTRSRRRPPGTSGSSGKRGSKQLKRLSASSDATTEEDEEEDEARSRAGGGDEDGAGQSGTSPSSSIPFVSPAKSRASLSTRDPTLRKRPSNVSILTTDSTYLAPDPAFEADLSLDLSRAKFRESSAGAEGPDGEEEALVRCTCCCGREECEIARRAAREWEEMEEDLRLAAEIGQALLRRNDALVASAQEAHAKHTTQRDSLMKRLTSSIKESGNLERQLAQCNLNLEASDSSNRTLLSELDDTRRQLTRAQTTSARSGSVQTKLRKVQEELDDARQETSAERKRAEQAEAKAKRSAKRSQELNAELKLAKAELEALRSRERKMAVSDEAIDSARERLRLSMKGSSESEPRRETDEGLRGEVESLSAENDELRAEMKHMAELLEARNEELAALREQSVHASGDDTPLSSLRGADKGGRRSRSGTATDSQQGTTFDESYQSASSALEEGPSADAGPLTSPTGSSHMQRPPTSLANELVEPTPSPASGARTPSHSAVSSPAAPVVVTPTVITPSGTMSSLGTESSSGSSMPLTPSPSPGHGHGFSRGATDEAHQMPQLQHQASEASESTRAGSTAPTTPTLGSHAGLAPDARREVRTSQLVVLLDYIQRLFSRLASADVDTLARRLRRQHLAGDVGHLARTTVNAILRDADGLRDHFRRIIEAEARNALKDDASSLGSGSHNGGAGGSTGGGGSSSSSKESDSLVARREFFALVKLFRDLFFEMAKLRNVINEVQLQPQSAAKILQDCLGAEGLEEKGVGAWFGRLLAGGAAAVPGAGAVLSAATGGASSSGAGGASSGGPGSATGPTPAGLSRMPSTGPGRLGSGAAGGRSASSGGMPTLAPRASAAVTSTTIAVEVKGAHASANAPGVGGSVSPGPDETTPTLFSSSPPSSSSGSQLRAQPGRSGPGSLTRTQSRNLSGLFAGSMGLGLGGGGAEGSGSGGLGWDVIDRREAGALGGANGESTASSPEKGGLGHLRNPTLRSLGQDRPGIGGGPNAHHPHRLSRIVDDDELSIHQATFVPERTLRPRGLSDSSIRSTFLDHEGGGGGGPGGAGGASRGGGGAQAMARPSPISRLITPSTLALQASASGAQATASRKLPPDGNEGPTSIKSGGLATGAASSSTAAAAKPSARGAMSFLGSGLGGFGLPIPSLRPRTSSAALTLAAAQQQQHQPQTSPAMSTSPRAGDGSSQSRSPRADVPGASSSPTTRGAMPPAAAAAARIRKDVAKEDGGAGGLLSSSVSSAGRGPRRPSASPF